MLGKSEYTISLFLTQVPVQAPLISVSHTITEIGFKIPSGLAFE